MTSYTEDYEGAEKRLEMFFFHVHYNNSRPPDLRDLQIEQIEEILKLAKCTIVHKHKDDKQLSFVLSESSLFITQDRILLKTCGTTTLLDTLPVILKYAKELKFVGYEIHYSHRAFQFPKHQPMEYQDFSKEVAILDKFCVSSDSHRFENSLGYCWNFYVGRSESSLPKQSNQKIEIMMQQLDPKNMRVFYEKNSKTGKEATKNSGIGDLFENADIADIMFKPCGYSANALMERGGYFTTHVTPQEQFSFVSFETNVELADFPKFMSSVLNIFGPKSLICTFYSDKDSSAHKIHDAMKDKDLVDGKYALNTIDSKVYVGEGRGILTVATYKKHSPSPGSMTSEEYTSDTNSE